MIRTKLQRTPVAFGKKAPAGKVKTLPDQSMSIKEIVRRYLRGVPPDVVQRQKVYIDQGEVDLEAMSRLDATDRAYQAQEQRTNTERLQAEVEANEQAMKERAKQRQAEAQRRAEGAQNPGIVQHLDNTMPDDTGLTNRKLPGRKK